jgi:hypothetical protein
VSCRGPGVDVCQTNDGLEIECSIKHLDVRCPGRLDEVIAFMNSNPGLVESSIERQRNWKSC